MAMPYVLSNIFSLNGPHGGLGRHERINTNNDQNDGDDDDDVGTGTNTVSSSTTAAAADPSSTTSSPDVEEGTASSSTSQPASTENAANSNTAEASETEASTAEQAGDDLTFQNEEGNNEENDTENGTSTNLDLTTRMAQLEEERELRRRRQSTCTIIVIFILFRLWVEALVEGDVGLLFISMVGTSWTAKWIRARREQEEEIDRRMEEYFRRAQREGGAAGDVGGLGVGLRRSPTQTDLTLMSFQAQLALAILESQRQMMENGGFGNPDGDNQANSGVSEEARSRWSRYDYTTSEIETGGKVRKDGYGSVDLSGDDDPGHEVVRGNADRNEPKKLVDQGLDDYEMPSCSICLCEYEEGESLTRLPCGHVYHEECVTAWVTNHIRCPLCNYDLMEDESSSSSPTTSTSTSTSDNASNVRILSHSDSIV